MWTRRTSTQDLIARGVVAGIAGTVVMTAWQKLVEMPLTKRADSFAPASFAEKVTPADPDTLQGRRRLNWATHFALGTMWGAAYGIAAAQGLRGQKAVNTVFAIVYAGDVALNTALGLYEPRQWSAKDVAIDVVDKYVQAQGTGAVFDRLLDPAR
jgi:alcohol dehydrogenase YqhD (iron-dependent ADH family)